REPGTAVTLEDAAQVVALDHLHDQIDAGVVLEVVDDVDNPRVVQAGQEARLDLEARDVADIQQPLDRDGRVVVAVHRAIDGTHRTGRQRRLDGVARKLDLHSATLRVGWTREVGSGLRRLLRQPPRRRLPRSD